jgi:hypothetical protein
VCGADRNYTGYCNPETDKLIDAQSMEANPEKRRRLVWNIERRLAEDASRPVLFYSRFPTCRQPYLKGLTIMTNSRFNVGGWRMCGSISEPRSHSAASFCGRTNFSRIVTNSSAALGWMPTVWSNIRFDAPHLTAIASPWMISGASAPSM